MLSIALSVVAAIISLGFSNNTGNEKLNKKAHKQFKKHFDDFVLIPAATYTVLNYPLSEFSYEKREISVSPYYLSKYEISNAKWMEFVNSVRLEKGKEEANKLLPDSSLWMETNYPMLKYYYRHPSYQNYPVTCISITQAKLYCQWWQEQLQRNEHMLFDSVIVRLPTEDEWEHAALGGNFARKYPWPSPYIRNAQGKFVANFRRMPMDEVKKVNNRLVLSIPIKPNPVFDGAGIPAPIDTYIPMHFGLYNMGGNVAEFVLADSSQNQKGELQNHFTKGGSFYDPPYYMQNAARDFYPADSSAHFSRGFRPLVKTYFKGNN